MKTVQCTLLAVLLMLGTAGAEAATATIERLSGAPKIFEIGDAGARKVSLPRQGAEYRLPIEVETGAADSALFRLPDSEISVAPNSIMRINAPESRDSGLFQRILQKAGSSFFSVERRTVEHFEVRTPYLVSVVKGTTFNVVVQDEGATVSLHEGRLLVSSPDGARSVDLLPGDVAYSTPEGEVRKLSHSTARQMPAPGKTGSSAVSASASAADTMVSVIDTMGVNTAVNAGQSTVDVPDETASLLTDPALPGLTGADNISGVLADKTTDLADLPGEIGNSLGSPLLETATGLIDGTAAVAGSAIAGIGGTAGDLVSGVSATTGNLVEDLGTTVGGLTGETSPLAGDLIVETGAAAGELVIDIGTDTGALTLDLSSAGADLLTGAGDGTSDLLDNAGGDLLSSTAGVLESTVDLGLDEPLDDLSTGLEGLGGGLRGLLP